jgi:threonine synthase
MTTVTDENVYNLAVHGTFDDCQDIVKSLFSDSTFNAKYHLGAVNSINWARILAQTVYYFHAYFQLQRSVPDIREVQFVVPTGNFGDILAGYYARRMGLPMGSCKLGVATNANDILARFWKTGRYEKEESLDESLAPELAPTQGSSDGRQGGGVKETLSPAMDILISSNFERLLWYLAYEDAGNDASKAGSVINGWMNSMKADGKVQVPTKVLEFARRDFCAERVDDNEVTTSFSHV